LEGHKEAGRKRKFLDIGNKFQVCREELKILNDGRRFCN
jgi:hypothetical protein